MAKFQRHLFVCVNQREPGDPRGCCADKGAEALAKAFKIAIHGRGLKRIVRPNKAGCLDQCEHGVTVVVYPEGVWYGGVSLADVDEIVDRHLVRGVPVERLRIPERELSGIDPAAPPSGDPADPFSE